MRHRLLIDNLGIAARRHTAANLAKDIEGGDNDGAKRSAEIVISIQVLRDTGPTRCCSSQERRRVDPDKYQGEG